MGPETLALLIPIVALLIPIFAIYFHHKEELERRKERMLAIEKGVELPPEPTPQPTTPLDYLRKGLICLGVGLALTLGGWTSAGKIGGPFTSYFKIGGLILTFIGAALVIYYKIQDKVKK